MEREIKKEGTYDFSKKIIEKLIVKANNVIIKNLKMNNLTNKCVQILGNNVTLSNCHFNQNTRLGDTFIQIKGQNCRITNCLFENFNEQGCIIYIHAYKSKLSYCLIDNCNFREMRCKATKPASDFNIADDYEIIKIGDTKSSNYDSKSIIYNNFFNQCDRTLVNVNSCSNIISHNKIIQCHNTIILKNGKNNKVIYNYINGNFEDYCSGICISGQNHLINYNTIESINNKDKPLRTAISLLCGSNDQPTKNIEISENDFLGCQIAFSLGVFDKTHQVLPSNMIITKNKIVKVMEMINNNPKCLGVNNSHIENNYIINKDVKIQIEKGVDIPENIENFYNEINIFPAITVKRDVKEKNHTTSSKPRKSAKPSPPPVIDSIVL